MPEPIFFTQTILDPGNCWQTAVACILAVEPWRLPPQELYDFGKVNGRKHGGAACSYHNVLQGYLGKHHGLCYHELSDFQFGGVDVKAPGWHLLIGPTVRTEVNNSHHCVVGRFGVPVWDVHPSKAGLLSVERWGVLSPLPARIAEDRQKRGDLVDRRALVDCLCPPCIAERGAAGDPRPGCLCSLCEERDVRHQDAADQAG